jgi:hypothetical protein
MKGSAARRKESGFDQGDRENVLGCVPKAFEQKIGPLCCQVREIPSPMPLVEPVTTAVLTPI